MKHVRVESPFGSKDSTQSRWSPPAAWQGEFSHLRLCQQLSNLQTNSTALSSKSAGQWFFPKIQTLHTGDMHCDALCSSLISLQKFSFPLDKPAAQPPAIVRGANRQGTAVSHYRNQGWSSALICTFLQISLLLCSFPFLLAHDQGSPRRTIEAGPAHLCSQKYSRIQPQLMKTF